MRDRLGIQYLAVHCFIVVNSYSRVRFHFLELLSHLDLTIFFVLTARRGVLDDNCIQ